MQRTLPLMLVALACLVAGCRKSTTYTAPDGIRATVTQGGNGTEVVIQGKDGATMRIAENGAGVSLPDGFPKDVPIYKGAVVVTSVDTKEGKQVSLRTPDALGKVVDFYKAELAKNGWEVESSMNSGDMGMCNAKKGDSEVVASAFKDGENTMISLMVHSKK